MSTADSPRLCSKPCRWYAQDSCSRGVSCKLRPELGSQVNVLSASASGSAMSNSAANGQRQSRKRTRRRRNTQRQPSDNQKQTFSTIAAVHSVPPSSPDAGAPRLLGGKIPSPAWTAGSSAKGTKCRFAHDSQVQEAAPRRAEHEAKRDTKEAAQQARSTQEEAEQLARMERAASRLRAFVAQARADARGAREEAEQLAGMEGAAARLQAFVVARADTRGAREEAEQMAGMEGAAARLRAFVAQARADARGAREEVERQARIAREEEERPARERAREEQECARREHEATRERERQARAAEIAKEDAARTIQRVVLGSIVTFSAGLNVDHVITGFESCTVRIKNLPLDAKEDEVRALFTQQGIEPGRFQFISMKRAQNGKQEAAVVVEAEAGLALSVGLDRLEFRDEMLDLELGAYNSPGSMNAAAERDTKVLTISWRAPSTCYAVEYPNIPHANRKIRDLNDWIFMGRRVKVEIYSIPHGRDLSSSRPAWIKISNLAHTVGDADVREFSGSTLVRRISSLSYDAAHAVRMLRAHVLYQDAPNAVTSFEQTFSECSLDGIITVRVQFTSWEEARKIYDTLVDQTIPYIGNLRFQLELPSPMFYTVTISAQQYKAQKTQWTALIENIEDKKACNLIVHHQGNIARLCASGTVKQAIGALKVRVESLIAGEKMDGWHSSLAYSGRAFVQSVLAETGAYVRVDCRQQVLKAYGEPKAIEAARMRVKAELQRLASREQTVILKKLSVNFFVRRGIPALKETFSEDSVKFDAFSRKITITGGEEARHALARLIDESLSDLPERLPAEQACPICYDEISSPFQLGCGHAYCMACLRHFLASALDSDQFPLVCMGDEARCRIPIAIPTIQRFLPPALFNRLLEVVFDKHIAKNAKELKYCTTPDCTQIYRAAEKDAASALQCPSCFSTICASCHEDAHEGMTCAEFRIHKDPTEQERLNDEWIAQQGGRVKKCPSCGLLIEKIEGCNHMSCRCGAHVCWRCMNMFSAETIYAHMHAQHGGIHDEEPALHVDYNEQQDLWQQAQVHRIQPPPVRLPVFADNNEGWARQPEIDREREAEQFRDRWEGERREREQEARGLQQRQEDGYSLGSMAIWIVIVVVAFWCCR